MDDGLVDNLRKSVGKFRGKKKSLLRFARNTGLTLGALVLINSAGNVANMHFNPERTVAGGTVEYNGGVVDSYDFRKNLVEEYPEAKLKYASRHNLTEILTTPSFAPYLPAMDVGFVHSDPSKSYYRGGSDTSVVGLGGPNLVLEYTSNKPSVAAPIQTVQ